MAKDDDWWKSHKKRFSEHIDNSIRDYKKENIKEIHKLILKKWREYAIVAILAFGIALVIYFGFLNRSAVEPLNAQQLAQMLFEASVTIIGILIGVFPVVSFFTCSQMEKRENKVRGELKDKELLGEVKQFLGEEYSKKLHSYKGLIQVMYSNFRVGVIRYTATYLEISISLLLALIFLYISINPLGYIIVDVPILITVLLGVLPILTVLNKIEGYLDLDTVLNPKNAFDKL